MSEYGSFTPSPTGVSFTEPDARLQPVIDFDHHSSEYWLDIEGYTDRARRTARVGWSPHHGGFWVVTRAKEARWVAQHPEIFSSSRYGAPAGYSNLHVPPEPLGTVLLEEYDPPEHGKYRRLFNVTLAPREVKELRPNIQKWVTYLIDQFIEKGECDLVTELTSPAPALITLDLLGFSTEDWHRYTDAFHNSFGFPPTAPEWQEAVELLQWVDEQCVAMAKARKEKPANDVASNWLGCEIDGAPIATERVAMLLMHLMIGGVETTGSLVSSVLKYLHENADDQKRLVREPDLLETATEEFIRCFPPAKNHGRVVIQNTEIAGCHMKKGEKVLLNWVSVNRDEEVFGEDSTSLVLDRFPNRHSSFSFGPHRCPGSHLARETFKEMITQVLARMPDYRIATDRVERFPDQSILGGFRTMPTTFTPGHRSQEFSAAGV